MKRRKTAAGAAGALGGLRFQVASCGRAALQMVGDHAASFYDGL